MGASKKFGHHGNKINIEIDTLQSIVTTHLSVIEKFCKEYT